jgi:hypothetical protein
MSQLPAKTGPHEGRQQIAFDELFSGNFFASLVCGFVRLTSDGRARARGSTVSGPRPADEDESLFERSCSLALARRSALLLVSHCQLTACKTRFCSAIFRAFARFSDLLSSLARSSAVPAVARRIQEMPKTLWLARGSWTRLNREPLLCL